jgi:cation transport protein ChaC
MLTGAYHPRWLRVKLDNTPDAPEARALAFVMNREHPAYAGRLPDTRVVDCLRHACGLYGPAREYLQQTLLGLATNGVDDPYLGRLWRLLQDSDVADAAQPPGDDPRRHRPVMPADGTDGIAAANAPHETV